MKHRQRSSTQQALKCFFQASNKCHPVPSTKTDVRDTAGNKSDVVSALGEQITTKSERDSLKWADEAKVCDESCQALVYRTCQALPKLRTFSHTTPLAQNVLPLTPYTAGSCLFSPDFSQRSFTWSSWPKRAYPCSQSSPWLLYVSFRALRMCTYLTHWRNVNILTIWSDIYWIFLQNQIYF